jgi:hypothetical protein
MNDLFRGPFFIFAISFVTLWLSGQIGASYRKLHPDLQDDVHKDLDVILAATLTLLGLIIGFSFSMASSRYDQRKTYEEAEANAIGTEYIRADLLPAGSAPKVRALLKDYLDQRILYYETRDANALRQIDAATVRLQNDLWLAVQVPATTQPPPVLTLAVSGMNDVLNSQGYTQAAWRNRIPTAAWALMGAIAICCNVLVSIGRHRPNAGVIRFLILPLVLSTAFFAIADIDSPRRGIIRVPPQNLISLAESLRAN